jgi:hypothetical protein
MMLAVSLALLLAPATTASAGVSNYSVWLGYGPVAGVSYQNQSIISTNTVMTGSISVRPTSGSIPGGWSGAQASLYLNGALCSSAAMYYDPYTSSAGWSGGSTVRYCGAGNYTTRGSTAAYNGNGYNYYYTATSPILTH